MPDTSTPPEAVRTRVRPAARAAAEPTTWRGKLWREVRGYAEALAIAYLVVTFVFTTVGVVGSSMEPNLDGGQGRGNLLRSLLTGDRVFIPKFDTWLRRAGVLGEFERGAVVVLREPANAPTALETGRRSFYIKRVIAQPGDRVRIERGQVYVNDYPVDQGFITDSGEIYVAPVDFPRVIVEDGEVAAFVADFQMSANGNWLPRLGGDNAYDVDDPRVQLFYGRVVDNVEVPEGTPEGVPVVLDLVVPEGTYFVMGDNRTPSGSEDSRYFGPIDAITIAGRATAVIWPPRRDGEWNWRLLPAPEAFDAVPDAPASASR
ncbi:MAG TPA: signal peptidase I [Trueperaceae bacterium]|jgi:signal peptidase I